MVRYFILMFCLLSPVFAQEAMVKPSAKLGLQLTVTPLTEHQYEITVWLESPLDLPELSVWMQWPDNLVSLQGPDKWQGSVIANQPKTILKLTADFSEKPTQISAFATWQLGVNNAFAESAYWLPSIEMKSYIKSIGHQVAPPESNLHIIKLGGS